MTHPDFEKTQIWAKNLIDTPPVASAIPPVMGAAKAGASAALPKKPVLKELTKEEKFMLATGGALAIGLGAIVITSLPDGEPVDSPPPVTAELTAPVLDIPVVKEPETPAQPTPPPFNPPPHRATHANPEILKDDKPAPAVTQTVTSPDEQHSLLEIPEHPQVASGIDDKVSFIEAFHAAREEVGPAGVFAWRDTYYSTFTDKEWESVPEDQKEQWLTAVQPIIDPEYDVDPIIEPPVTEDFQNVVVAERGQITWTGIDKNGDGQAEVLMARINGQSPMILMDTDGDGILDTRYDYDLESGKTFASEITPFSMSTADIEHMEYVEVGADMGFYDHSGSEQISGTLPVSIAELDNGYLIHMDSNMDNTIDALTLMMDERGPVVGLDFDNDGQIEMGYIYNPDSQLVSAIEMEPLEEMSFIGPEEPNYSYAGDPSYLEMYQPAAHSELAVNDEDEQTDDVDSYFDNNSDLADDYVGS